MSFYNWHSMHKSAKMHTNYVKYMNDICEPIT